MVTAGSPETKTPPARPTVLCVDDDPLVLHFYRDHLEPRYRTLTVTDGLQGLAMAQQDRPDVILLDVLLRGWSGFDICRSSVPTPCSATSRSSSFRCWTIPAWRGLRRRLAQP